MIKDMYNVMSRINEIKKRFGLTKPNMINNANKNNNSNKIIDNQKKENYQKILDKHNEKNIITKNKNESRTDYINRIVDHYSNKNKISSPLVKAIIDVESKYNPNAVSKKGAKGLMQLMPSVIKDMNVNNPFLPEDNIRAGVGLLKNLLKGYNGDYKKTISAYNAGKQAVKKYNGVPEYKETKEYLNKVIKSYMQNK